MKGLISEGAGGGLRGRPAGADRLLRDRVHATDDLVDPCYPQRYEATARHEVNDGVRPADEERPRARPDGVELSLRGRHRQLTPAGMEHLTYIARRRPQPGPGGVPADGPGRGLRPGQARTRLVRGPRRPGHQARRRRSRSSCGARRPAGRWTFQVRGPRPGRAGQRVDSASTRSVLLKNNSLPRRSLPTGGGGGGGGRRRRRRQLTDGGWRHAVAASHSLRSRERPVDHQDSHP